MAAVATPTSGTRPNGASAIKSLRSTAASADPAGPEPTETTKAEPLPALAAASPMPSATIVSDASAAAQIAGALNTLRQDLASSTSAPDSGASMASGASAGAPSGDAATATTGLSQTSPREMVIQLDPEHLGTVSIKMRMVGGKLDIDIRVANAQTLDVLNKDRHILSAAVEAAGGTSDTFLLRTGAGSQPTPESGGGLAGSGTGPEQQRQQAFSSSASFSDGGRGQAPAEDSFTSDTTRDEDHASVSTTAARSQDGSLYL